MVRLWYLRLLVSRSRYQATNAGQTVFGVNLVVLKKIGNRWLIVAHEAAVPDHATAIKRLDTSSILRNRTRSFNERKRLFSGRQGKRRPESSQKTHTSRTLLSGNAGVHWLDGEGRPIVRESTPIGKSDCRSRKTGTLPAHSEAQFRTQATIVVC